MNSRRLNKEYKLDICEKINVKYGSVNKDNPQVIYVSGKCWISPLEKLNYAQAMEKIEKKMRRSIKLSLENSSSFNKRFILDFDVNPDNMSVGNKKFLSFDFFLRQNEENKRPLKDIKGLLSSKVGFITNDLVFLLSESGFNVEKRK